MRIFYSYARLFIACWLFMGGLSLQFLPSAAAMAHNARWRERQLQSIPADQQAQWIEDRDNEDGRAYAYVRMLGVVLGGMGLAMALREAAYLAGKYGR